MAKTRRKASEEKGSSTKASKVPKMDGSDSSTFQGENSVGADTPAQKALNNTVILSKLLQYLSNQDILKLRLLNRALADCGTSILRRRKYFRLAFGFRTNEKYFVLRYDGDDDVDDYNKSKYSAPKKILKLSELTQLIEAPGSKFPCTAFLFCGIPHLQQSDLMDFFSKFGQQLTQLYLNFEQPQTDKFVWDQKTVHELGDILLNKIPMVKDLTIESGRSSFNPNDYRGHGMFPKTKVKGSSDSISLPNLKKLVVIGPFKGFLSLLQAAVNLKKLYGLEPAQIDAVIEAGKSNLVTSLNPPFDPADKSIGLYEKLVNTASSWTRLDINLQSMGYSKDVALRSRIAKALSTALENSKTSLKTLSICMEGLVFHEVKWPSMEKVKELVLYRQFRDDKGWTYFRTQNQPIPEPKIKFRAGFLSETFPNLESLGIHSEVEQGGIIEKFLVSGDPGKKSGASLSKLKLFVFMHRVSNATANKLPLLMPNLEKLYGRQLIMFPREWTRFIWKFPKLQSVHLEVNTGDACLHGDDLFPHMDSFFTGLSEEMVIKLQKRDYFRKMAKQVDKIKRSHPSILDCKELKEVRLSFTQDTIDEVGYGYRFFTEVTGEFCLKLMPQLKFKAGPDMDKFPKECHEDMQEYKEMVEDALKPIGAYIQPLKDPEPASA